MYPGSTTVRRLGGDQLDASGGGSSGFAGGIFTTRAQGEEVYAWYDAQLLGHGWRAKEVPLLSTETSAREYIRGTREYINVGIDDPGMLSKTVGQAMATGQTLYEFTYTVDPSQ